MTEESDYEKQRLANIAERDALLRKLTQEAQQAGLYSGGSNKAKVSSKAVNGSGPQGANRGKTRKREAKEEQVVLPRRTSSRLAGLTADSEVAREKAERDYEAVREAERAKRRRIAGDQGLDDILIEGGNKWNGKAKGTGEPLLAVDVINRNVAKPYHKTFLADDEIRQTSDKELKAIRKKMSGLALWDAWEPTRIKITPERIYSMIFHPTEAKPLVFAGDKLGHLGIVDASQERPGGRGGRENKQNHEIKKEEDEEEPSRLKNKQPSQDKNPRDTDPSLAEDGDDDYDDPDPEIIVLKPHQRTISAMHTHHTLPHTLFTASYDSSIRGLDLEKSISSDLYALDDEPISGIDMPSEDPHLLCFTTLQGNLGRHDTRTKGEQATDLYQVSDKKIGGFSLHPSAPHYVATASLDRTMRLWDLRKITKNLPTMVGEHVARLSVSHAAFNSAGQVATSSYDDCLRIHSFGVSDLSSGSNRSTSPEEAMPSWKAGYRLDSQKMNPEVVVRHNCQTGRWVTM